MDNKKGLKRAGIFVAIVAVIALWINRPRIFSTIHEDAILKENKRIEDSLRTLLDTCQSYHTNYDNAISNMEDSLARLNILIQKQHNKILYFNQYEKVNNVSKFTSNDISRFLSDRYKDSIK